MARGRSGRKTDYEWQTGLVSIDLIDLAVNAGGMEDVFTLASPGTIVRVRGELLVQLDAGAVDERVVLALGLKVVSENAAAAGVASVPGPFVDGADDWFWHGYAVMLSLAEAAVVNEALFARVHVDSKAMRRVKPSEHIVFVAQVAGSTDQAGTVDILGGLRILFAS